MAVIATSTSLPIPEDVPPLLFGDARDAFPSTTCFPSTVALWSGYRSCTRAGDTECNGIAGACDR